MYTMSILIILHMIYDLHCSINTSTEPCTCTCTINIDNFSRCTDFRPMRREAAHFHRPCRPGAGDDQYRAGRPAPAQSHVVCHSVLISFIMT